MQLATSVASNSASYSDPSHTLDISESLISDLLVRRLQQDGTSNLTTLKRILKLPRTALEPVFRHLLDEHLVEIRGMVGEDYQFALTAAGRRLALDRQQICQYVGPAPVSLAAYHAMVHAQRARIHIKRSTLSAALSDLVLPDALLDKLGPAIVSQRALFLYGPTGNGKTSLAIRLARVFEDSVWIPYAVEVDSQIITVYDPAVHHKIEPQPENSDARWVLCHRPSILTGGELTYELLELKLDPVTKVYAAPLQMKANNGILVIDDFGRQVIPPRDLLNRWILPLDRRVDFLSLSYGIKFEIPFELMVVFATNLAPHSLADEAFLRRIPNKVYIGAVSSDTFQRIFAMVLKDHNLQADPETGAYLEQMCRRYNGSGLRACYPSDLCNSITWIQDYEERPVRITVPDLEKAGELYFVSEQVHLDEA